MEIKKALLPNIMVQSFGPALSFLSVFLLAKYFGPEIQGKFANFKSLVDLITVIGVYGFPQSFVYLMNKLEVSPKKLAFLSLYYVLGFVFFAFILLSFSVRLGYIDKSLFDNYYFEIFLLTIVCSILVLHGLWRGVYLGYDQGKMFAFFTIIPAIGIFILISFCIYKNHFSALDIYSYSAIPILIIICILMYPIKKADYSHKITRIPWHSLFNHGTHAFSQSLILSIQPIIAYWIIKSFIGGNKEIGFFNLGLFLVQGLAVPISMIAPLLFARWTKSNNYLIILKFNKLRGKLILLDVVFGFVLAFAIQFIINLFFSEEYKSAILLSQVLLFTVPLMLHRTIISPAIHAFGYPSINTVACGIRIIAFLLSVVLLFALTGKSLFNLALSWSIGEIFAALYAFFNLYKLSKIANQNI